MPNLVRKRLECLNTKNMVYGTNTEFVLNARWIPYLYFIYKVIRLDYFKY